MKKLLTLLLSFLLITPLFSQKRDITLEDLWKNYSFSPKSYSGLNSMNDGEHYSTMEKTEGGQEIIKYQFKNGKKVRTLFKSADFKIPKIRDYTFSKNEKHLTSLDDAILFGKNLNWLEKKRLHLVIGMYEDNTTLLPALSNRQYKAALMPILDAIFSRMENERVTPIGEKLVNALNATGKIKVTELTSELEMLEQGYAQKHCVGGYFHQVKSRQCIILDVVTPEEKKYTVEYRVVTRDGEFGFTKNQCKGVNNRPMPQEIKKLLPEFFSDNGHEKEWFLKNTYASQRGLQGNEIDFDYDDDTHFLEYFKKTLDDHYVCFTQRTPPPGMLSGYVIFKFPLD